MMYHEFKTLCLILIRWRFYSKNLGYTDLWGHEHAAGIPVYETDNESQLDSEVSISWLQKNCCYHSSASGKIFETRFWKKTKKKQKIELLTEEERISRQWPMKWECWLSQWRSRLMCDNQCSLEFFFYYQSNTYVECLDLSDNDIGCDGMVSIAHMLTENYFITELSMYFFNRNDFVCFPSWTGQGQDS